MVDVICHIDTADEMNYYRYGGIQEYVLCELVKVV
jgi:aconitase A